MKFLSNIENAGMVKYNNNTSGMAATTTQAAIDELKTLNNNLTAKVVWKALDFKIEADKPSAYPEQQTTIFVATQAWQGVAYLIIRTEKYNNNIAIQYLQPNGNLAMPVMYRLAIPDTDTWSSWQKIVTDKQPNWIQLTLQNGWTGNAYCRKNSLGQLELFFDSCLVGAVSDFTTIATLPTGYTPITNTSILVYNNTTGENLPGIVVLVTREIKIRPPATTKLVAGQGISIYSLC